MKTKKVLKIVGIIILILIVLVLVHTIRNYIIVRGLNNNFMEYKESTNYHIKSVNVSQVDDSTVTMDYYTKDGRQMVRMERVTSEETLVIMMYDNGERVDMFYDNDSGKTCNLDVDSEIVKVGMYNCLETDNGWQTMLSCVTARITSTNYNEKECYIVSNYLSTATLSYVNQKNYIEKDTGLYVKMESDDLIVERECEFDNVDDSVFVEPDIGQYTIQENE